MTTCVPIQHHYMPICISSNVSSSEPSCPPPIHSDPLPMSLRSCTVPPSLHPPPRLPPATSVAAEPVRWSSIHFRRLLRASLPSSYPPCSLPYVPVHFRRLLRSLRVIFPSSLLLSPCPCTAPPSTSTPLRLSLVMSAAADPVPNWGRRLAALHPN